MTSTIIRQTAAAAALVVAATALAGSPLAQTGSDGQPNAPEGPANSEDIDLRAIAKTARDERARRAVDRCEAGSAKACYRLGDMIRGGDGITRNNALGVALIDRACHAGFEPACYDMGVRFHQGLVVDQDLHVARVYFQHACSAGVGVACHMLAVDARDGVGVDVDVQLAHGYFERACALGYSPDCATVGWPIQHRAGRFETSLPASASDKLHDQARICDSGLMSGCIALAHGYDTGAGISADRAMAYRLYQIACDWGDLAGCAVYRSMESK